MISTNVISKDAAKLLVRLERNFDKALIAIRKAQAGKKFGAREANGLLDKLCELSDMNELDTYAFDIENPS